MARPQGLGDAHLQRLAASAIEAAISVPERQNIWAHKAAVPWAIIVEIRAELTAAGIDWRAMQREAKRRTDAARAEAVKEREERLAAAPVNSR